MTIDLTKLLDKAAGKEKANMFTDVMNLLGGDWAKVGKCIDNQFVKHSAM